MEATPTNAFRIVRLGAAYADEQNLRKDGVDKFRCGEYPNVPSSSDADGR